MKRLCILMMVGFLFCSVLACQSNASDGTPIGTIARIITSTDIFKVTPKNVVDALRGVVPLKSDGAGPYTYVFLGSDVVRGVAWARVEFQPGESEDEWILLQMQFGLPTTDATGKPTYSSLYRILEDHLGKPSWIDEDTSNGRVGWAVGDYNEIIIKKGSFLNPLNENQTQSVVVDLAVNQGEPEN
jgi:hypothetical protein